MNNSIPKTSGIYKITCTANGKIYIGSSNNCKARWVYHRRNLRGNRHHSLHMQNAWNKYGESAFVFEVIEMVAPSALENREQYWLDLLQPYKDTIGFNISTKAYRLDYWLGKKHTPETRIKMRLAQIGHTLSVESREKIAAARKGKPISNETKAKISAKTRGRKLSPEHIAKVVAANTGTKRSAEACKNIGASKSKSYIVTTPDGVELRITNLKQFCIENGIEYTSLSKVANGNKISVQGWKARHDNKG